MIFCDHGHPQAPNPRKGPVNFGRRRSPGRLRSRLGSHEVVAPGRGDPATVRDDEAVTIALGAAYPARLGDRFHEPPPAPII